MTKEEFFNLINELNIVLNDDQKQQFELYCKLLLESESVQEEIL